MADILQTAFQKHFLRKCRFNDSFFNQMCYSVFNEQYISSCLVRYA